MTLHKSVLSTFKSTNLTIQALTLLKYLLYIGINRRRLEQTLNSTAINPYFDF